MSGCFDIGCDTSEALIPPANSCAIPLLLEVTDGSVDTLLVTVVREDFSRPEADDKALAVDEVEARSKDVD